VTPHPLPASLETVRAVADSMPASVELWLGGPGALVDRANIRRPGTVFFDDLQAMERLLVKRNGGMQL
jgi:hypothetical protein